MEPTPRGPKKKKVTKKTSPKKKKEVAAEEDPGSPELAEIAEEGDDQDAAEAAAAAALLAEVMRPLRMTHPPPEDADYLKTNPAPQTQRKAPQTAPSALSKVGLLSTPGMAEPESVSYLIANYAKLAPDVELVGFVNGYQGLLLGQTIAITPDMRDKASKGALLTLIKSADCRDPLLVASLSAAIESPSLAVTHGVCKEGDEPMRVAAEQVKTLGLQVLHVIGGYETVNAAVEVSRRPRWSVELSLVLTLTITITLTLTHSSLPSLTARCLPCIRRLRSLRDRDAQDRRQRHRTDHADARGMVGDRGRRADFHQRGRQHERRPTQGARRA